MDDLAVRTGRRIGWLLFVLGVIVVVGYAAYAFATDDAVPAFLKTAVAAVVVGLVLLLISVLRQRLVARKTDKYKEVEI